MDSTPSISIPGDWNDTVTFALTMDGKLLIAFARQDQPEVIVDLDEAINALDELKRRKDSR